MKIEVSSKAARESREYPKLMISKDLLLVVLMSAEKQGVVIDCTGVYEVGHFSTDWHMDSFEDFEGSITLSND